ncbi:MULTISPECIES: endonuclease/exonuclease/phosphatase family protein [unclassified Luteococcus]|uniref:endonuclease/exonuclease/phosphatase family protein n=1 Tax=unclassified Luteococcus TaxID=2639923 RepID=UPI00313BD54C
MRTPRISTPRLASLALAATLVAGLAVATVPGHAAPLPVAKQAAKKKGTDPDVRFATFNASLNRAKQGQLVADLSTPDNAQARTVAEIIQRANPDVVLVNEFDYVAGGRAAELFRDNYLAVGQNGAGPVHYPYYYVAPVNTGVPSGHDLNNDGTVGGPDDAWGFGAFPGQYGMVVYSKYPIDQRQVRTFQNFRWRDMPGALLPDDPATGAKGAFYSSEELAAFPLSSKSHWDLPIMIGRKRVHLLASHPTPPVFDGPEDRNGRRNHDEIRLWADYITGGKQAAYLYDDQGRRGGLKRGERFVIAGDQNSDPVDGDSLPGSIAQLLDHPRVNTSVTPASEGGPEAARLQGQANATHTGDPRFDTADFGDAVGSSGNIRADYVLPSRNLPILGAAVFWPTQADPLYRLTGSYPFPSSDHRLVWVDVKLPHPSPR